jgi:hypothetical protein
MMLNLPIYVLVMLSNPLVLSLFWDPTQGFLDDRPVWPDQHIDCHCFMLGWHCECDCTNCRRCLVSPPYLESANLGKIEPLPIILDSPISLGVSVYGLMQRVG